MVSAISSIENLDVNERIQTKSVTPVKDNKDSESESGSTNVKSLNLEDYTYGQHTPKTSDKQVQEEKKSSTEQEPESQNEIQTVRRTLGASVGGLLSDNKLDQLSVADSELLMGDISKTNRESTDLLEIPTSTNLKTIVINVNDNKTESTIKKITVDAQGHVLKEETKTTDKHAASKQKKMKEDKRNIDNLVTSFQQKKQNVESLMLQLKQSIASGDVDNIHTLTTTVSNSISSLRSEATSLYNKVSLYESNVYDSVHVNNKSESGYELIQNNQSNDTSDEINQQDQQVVDTQIGFTRADIVQVASETAENNRTDRNPLINHPAKLDTDTLSQSTIMALDHNKVTKTLKKSLIPNSVQARSDDLAVVNRNKNIIITSDTDILTTNNDNLSDLEITTNLANAPINNSNLKNNNTDNNQTYTATTNDVNTSQTNTPENNTSIESTNNNLKTNNSNNGSINAENSSKEQTYVQNISITNQVAAASALSVNTGILNMGSVNHNTHKSQVGMRDNSPIDLDMAVEEISKTETDNPNSSNSDRHDNHETYQQQDMDSGYNNKAINAYSNFNNKNNDALREKQRKLNNLRYERTSTNENLDLMEDQLTRLSSESNRVKNEENIIAKAPKGIQDQMKQEAISRRKQRLSFM